MGSVSTPMTSVSEQVSQRLASGLGDRVTVHRNGKRLHFILETTTDFEFFLEAVYVDLVEKTLIG